MDTIFLGNDVQKNLVSSKLNKFCSLCRRCQIWSHISSLIKHSRTVDCSNRADSQRKISIYKRYKQDRISTLLRRIFGMYNLYYCENNSLSRLLCNIRKWTTLTTSEIDSFFHSNHSSQYTYMNYVNMSNYCLLYTSDAADE